MTGHIPNHETPSYSEQSTQAETLARAELNLFLTNPGLREMAELFTPADVLPNDQPLDLLRLQKIAAEHWDFRKGAERQTVDWNDTLLDQEGSAQWNIIFSAADKLRLVQDTEPTNKKPASLVILGGANRAPLDRLRYGLERVEDFGQVAYLGSSREISDTEKQKASDYAPNAQTEFDLGCGAFETLLGAEAVDEIIEKRAGDIWGMRLYAFTHHGEAKHGFVLSTPQRIGSRRATTYDNYSFFAERAELASDPLHTVVAVTTGFYKQAQHMPAVRELTLKYGINVETIGHSAQYSGATRKPSQLLQETKRAIDAAVKLQIALG